MRFILLLLLLCQPIHAATKLMFGAELNSILEITQGSNAAIETTIKNAGCCSLRIPAGTNYCFLQPAALNSLTLYTRFYLRVAVSVNPTGSTTVLNGLTMYNGATDVSYIRVVVTTAGAVSLRLYNAIAAAQVGSDYSISKDTWYLVEQKAVISATVGQLEMKVNGTSRAAGTSLNTGSTNITQIVPTAYTAALNGMTANLYFDDVLASDSAYPGAGSIIARQAGGAGTPTYNTWTKTGGSLPAIWADISYNSATLAVSLGASSPSAQTYFIGSFSSTQTCPGPTNCHGTETVSASDTINAVQGIIVAVTGASALYDIRRRVNGVNTDTLLTPNVSATVHRETPWTDTLTNINAMELGGEQNSNGSTFDIYDTYVLMDYTVSTATPVTLIPLLSRRRR